MTTVRPGKWSVVYFGLVTYTCVILKTKQLTERAQLNENTHTKKTDTHTHIFYLNNQSIASDQSAKVNSQERFQV